MSIAITIILGSNRPQNIEEFVSNIESTASNPSQVEIIFSIDKGDQKCIDVLKSLQKKSKITVKYLEGIRKIGYFEANIHYNNCLHLADRNSYFFAIFSDKLQMETIGWDDKLVKYIGFFKDDFFRVRISNFKNIRYNSDLNDALTRPDNFAFHTRKFIEICGGWGDTWGPDTWVQGVVFFCEVLGLRDRDLVANEINLKKYQYSDSRGVNRNSLIRNLMCCWSFKYLSTNFLALQNFLRIAIKAKFYVENAKALKNHGKYRFCYDNNHVTIFNGNEIVINSMPITQINSTLKCDTDNKERQIVNQAMADAKILARRIEKRKNTKNKLKKFVISLNIILAKFKIKFKSKFNTKKIISTINLSPNVANYDFGSIIKIQSNSSQFVIESNSLIEEEVNNQYENCAKEADMVFPPKFITLAKENKISDEILSFADNLVIVTLLRDLTKNQTQILDNKKLALFYFKVAMYLMHSGLPNLAAEMFRLSLEKEDNDEVAILYLQNLMYVSEDQYSQDKILTITKEVMQNILQKENLQKYKTYDNKKTNKKILNIGYTCHFFDNETSSNLLLPILKAHNRNRVKIFIYSDQNPSITKNKTKEIADVWRDTYNMSNYEFCELVRQDQIDILLELNGFCAKNRYAAIKAKPSPIQVSFYNLSASSGIEEIDYVISTNDINLDQKFYSEKIINKEGVYLTISPEIKKISNIAACTKNGYITFGSFGQIHKVSRNQIAIWCEILKQVEDSKLYLKSNDLHRQEIITVFRKHFDDYGIDSHARVIFEGYDPYDQLIQCYEKVDIALDTYPYAGGTTTSEALLCGVPVIHLTGTRFCSQHGTNYLRFCKAEELICYNKDEFINKAVTLANDIERIKNYHKTLPDLVRNSKKCDIAQYTKELEDVYFKMWEKYLETDNK